MAVDMLSASRITEGILSILGTSCPCEQASIVLPFVLSASIRRGEELARVTGEDLGEAWPSFKFTATGGAVLGDRNIMGSMSTLSDVE